MNDPNKVNKCINVIPFKILLGLLLIISWNLWHQVIISKQLFSNCTLHKGTRHTIKANFKCILKHSHTLLNLLKSALHRISLFGCSSNWGSNQMWSWEFCEQTSQWFFPLSIISTCANSSQKLGKENCLYPPASSYLCACVWVHAHTHTTYTVFSSWNRSIELLFPLSGQTYKYPVKAYLFPLCNNLQLHGAAQHQETGVVGKRNFPSFAQ